MAYRMSRARYVSYQTSSYNEELDGMRVEWNAKLTSQNAVTGALGILLCLRSVVLRIAFEALLCATCFHPAQ